jgi:hypothetical protein
MLQNGSNRRGREGGRERQRKCQEDERNNVIICTSGLILSGNQFSKDEIGKSYRTHGKEK